MGKKKNTSEKEEKRGRIKVGKLKGTRELSAADAKKVKGGRASLSDINFVHSYDKASPVLLVSDPKK